MKISYSHNAAYIEKLKSIEQLINQDQLHEAAAQLNLLVKKAPQDPRLYLLGSRLAEVARNPDGMLQAARKAHQLSPQWHVATLHLATVLASSNAVEEAMSLAAKAIRQSTGQTTGGLLDPELLVRVATLAQNVGQHEQALTWLRQAASAAPNDWSIRYKIGLTLRFSGDPKSAIEVFNDLLLELPDNPTLLAARLLAAIDAKEHELAVRDGKALVAIQPDNDEFHFYLAIARGDTPKTQPASVVTSLFDGSAARFDHHLVAQLKYKLPRDVANMINVWHSDRKGDVLDLGCGTGLLGACLGPIEGALVGVDLSADMLGQAAKHGVYDRFHQVNLLDALQATPANLYHVITALDVLIYVGNLETFVPNAHRILVPGGRLVCSFESGREGDADYVLQETHRYTHQRRYVRELMEQSGFEEVTFGEKMLRMEKGNEVQGFLVTARKSQQVPEKSVQRLPKNAKLARPPQ